MHPTRDTTPLIKRNLAGGRVMPGVRSPESAAARLWAFHGGARGRPNIGMHATADTEAVKLRRGAGRRVMPALDRLNAPAGWRGRLRPEPWAV